MREWYNGYRFAKNVETDMYNTDMVLYYLKQSVPNESMPEDPVDVNVRIDYGKLRHLLTVSREAGARLNGNFDLLRQVAGEGVVEANVNPSFPLKRLTDRDNFLSLLHYFGLLSIRRDSGAKIRLGIPNQTVRRLLYGHLRDGWQDAGAFDADVYQFSMLVWDMAYEGAWRPAVEHLRDAIAAQTGIRDYIDGEKVAHAFMAAHFSMVGQFVIHSERELNKGYADLHLEPFLEAYPTIAYGYVIELKYLKRGEAVDAAVVSERLERAKTQLRRYLGDEGLRRRQPSVRHVGLALVFHGWELVASEGVEAV